MLQNNRKKNSVYYYLGICIMLWAAIPVATKKILVELDNLQTLFYSTFFSVLIMGIVVVATKKTKDFKKYRPKQYGKMCFLGFLGNYLYYVLLYLALDMTKASEGFILAYTWPMLVLILSFILLKEKVTSKKVLGIMISFLGIIIITTQGRIVSMKFSNFTGDMLAILAAIALAFFSVVGKKCDFDQIISVFVYFLAAFIFLIPTVAIFSEFTWPSISVWPWIIFNGVLVNGVSYVLWFKVLKEGKTHIVSNSLYLTPFVSLIYIRIFLNEKIDQSAVLGLAVIVFGILLQFIKISSRNRKTAIKS